MAMSACPSRHGRPKLSAIKTAGELPEAAAISPRIRRAEASASTGSSETCPSGRLEESIPAFAQIQPALVSVTRTPRSARAIRHRGPRPRACSLRMPLVLLLDEHLVAEPPRLPRNGLIRRHNQDILDRAAPWQLHDQVQEEGLGKPLALIRGKDTVQPPVRDGESFHRNDRSRVHVFGIRPHGEIQATG